MADTRATVFGGSGFIGRHLAAQLATSGLKVRVAVRHADRISDQPVEVVAGDVLDDSSVASAVQGASAVINLVGILSESGRQTYTAVHVEAARRVALAARNAGASRLIHLSALGATKAAPALSDCTKAEGEVVVRAAFPQATIIRPSLVFGSDDHFFTRFAEMAQRSPVLPLIGSGATKFQPAHVEDVAAGIARVLTRSDTAGRVYEFGGPEVYSLKGLLDLMLAAVGWRRLFQCIQGKVCPLNRCGRLFLHRFENHPRQQLEFALRVECSVGHRGEPTPTRFSFGGAPIKVVEVVDAWLATDHRCRDVADNDDMRESEERHAPDRAGRKPSLRLPPHADQCPPQLPTTPML